MKLATHGASVIAALAAVCGLTTRALAGEPPVGSVTASGACASTATVLRWSASDGPLARFVADAYGRHPGVFVALGVADRAFWSVEAHPAVDACDDCNEWLHLVRTARDGTRRRYLLIDGDARDSADARAVHTRILSRLWGLVRDGTLPLARLGADYALRLPPPPVDEDAPSSAWTVEVSERASAQPWRLRFALIPATTMCWCTWDWQSYALRASDKR